MNETCKIEGMYIPELRTQSYSLSFTLLDDKTVYCKNGKALSIMGDFCQECQECPVRKYASSLALTSNCSKSLNNYCPRDLLTSKICMDKINDSITDHCSYVEGDEPWLCPKANKGLDFEQCYDL